MKKNHKRSEEKDEKPKKGFPIPAGTEQETGLTRGETEKKKGPVKIKKDDR
jgi:hypothetical protein